MHDCPDVRRVDVAQLAFLFFPEVQDVVVEPLGLDEDLLQLFLLPSIKLRRLDLAFECPDYLTGSARLRL